MASLGGGGAEGDGDEEFPGRILHQVAIYNNTEFLASLLLGEEKDNINARDPFGRTALYTAVTNNSLQCARLLLENGGEQSGVEPELSKKSARGGDTPMLG